MITYLTKTQDGKLYHYRVSVVSDGVDIVEGIRYNSITKFWEGCGSVAAAGKKLQELVEQKKQDGYTETSFTESPENTLQVYDKAKWHFDGDFPDELESFQGYVHTGMFLGWLADSQLLSEFFMSEFPGQLQRFSERTMTGPQLFEAAYDGVLTLEDISETGNRFALSYFEFESGLYLKDYGETLATGLPTMYHVEDNWENYRKLKAVLDRRFADWKKNNP